MDFRAFIIAGAGIGVISAAILVGPMLSDPAFSVLRHSTSEQAGQAMTGARLMRTGFVAYGAGTALAALLARTARLWVRMALFLFGLGLIGTAIWSNASIVPGVVSDMREDWLHSVTSGVVGTAFAAACAARLFLPGGSRRDALAWAGLAIAVAVPLAMSTFPEVRGLLQRSMFAFSFVFVLREFGEELT